VQRVQAHPQKFWFVENPGKIPENPNNLPKYLGKIPENLGKNGAQGLQKNKWRPFLEITPQKGRQKLHDNCLGEFGKIWSKNLCTTKNSLARSPMILGQYSFRPIVKVPCDYYEVVIHGINSQQRCLKWEQCNNKCFSLIFCIWIVALTINKLIHLTPQAAPENVIVI